MNRTLLLALVAVFLLVELTNADDGTLPDGVEVQPLFAGGSASDNELLEAVGTPSFSMDKCPASETEDQRVVRAQLEKPAFETAPVINALLDKAARYAWKTCLEPFLWLGSGKPIGEFHYDLSEVDAFLPDGQKAFCAVLGMYGMGDGAFAPDRRNPWRNYTNFAALARAKTAADAQTQANAQAQAAYRLRCRRRPTRLWPAPAKQGRTCGLLLS